MPGYLEQLLDYNSWATARLLDTLGNVPAEVLDAAGPGGYGTVRETMTHVLSAERSYVARLSGGTPPADPLEALDLAGLHEQAAELRAAAAELAERLPKPETVYQRRLGPVTAATVFTQLVQHGCEHRAQVTSILSAHGIAVPSLEPWAHGREIAGLPPLE
jgi:uncharacterized damage-inducible protein DinB